MARHDAMDLPFRSWCPVRLEPRAVEDPHYRRTIEQGEHGIPQVCDDYCEICGNAKDETDKQWSLVARDTWPQAIYANIVDAKGNGDVEGAKGLKNFMTILQYNKKGVQ